jgi:hypothetical protein
MSHPLVSRSPDLRRLVADGYEIRVVSDHLVVENVPYLDATGEIEYGRLICELVDGGGVTGRPNPHTAHFSGVPFDGHGNQLTNVVNSVGTFALATGLEAQTYLSQKPAVGYYEDYHAKVTQYVKIISGPAMLKDRNVTARTHRVLQLATDDSVFQYLDSASSRVGITELSERLDKPIGIIGLGGTGAYILDLAAKTHSLEIHLWDGDAFQTHNAFRAPGAASLDELNARPMKVDYYTAKYAPMRRGIVPHPEFVDETNVEELAGLSFIFLAMDTGPAKRMIIGKLEELDIPFVDTGIGVKKQRDSLGGIVRTTASIPGHRDHIGPRISFADEQDDDYDRNIQVAELNMLNAVHAVIKWKKYATFYLDLENELHSTYSITSNILINEDVIE